MAEQQRRIVVGVDGSRSSKAALRWAIRQAKLTGDAVNAVTAWHYPSRHGWAAGDGVIDPEGDGMKTLTDALNEVSGLEPEVPVHPQVIEGPAAEVLQRVAQGADLLVVGSRGHGGVTSALLGSVSLNCALRAPCPVLVFRDGHPES
jgi:nucleotide-binding universal stress UspA family protein